MYGGGRHGVALSSDPGGTPGSWRYVKSFAFVKENKKSEHRQNKGRQADRHTDTQTHRQTDTQTHFRFFFI